METMTGDATTLSTSCDAEDEVTFYSAACTQAETAATLLAVQMEV